MGDLQAKWTHLVSYVYVKQPNETYMYVYVKRHMQKWS